MSEVTKNNPVAKSKVLLLHPCPISLDSADKGFINVTLPCLSSLATSWVSFNGIYFLSCCCTFWACGTLLAHSFPLCYQMQAVFTVWALPSEPSHPPPHHRNWSLWHLAAAEFHVDSLPHLKFCTSYQPNQLPLEAPHSSHGL